MKKTVALIYRLIFILISVWALWSRADGLSFAALSDLSVFSVTVNALTALAVFLWSIKTAPPGAVLRTKAVFAAVAAAVIFVNRGMLLSGVNLSWIICILLPLMAIVDWLLFDKKGMLKILDLLLWLLAALGLMAILGLDIDRILSVLFPVIASLGLMLLLDSLFSGKKTKADTLSLLLEIAFLVLEGYGFYLLTGPLVEVFVDSLKGYTALSNLIAFAAAAVSLIIRLMGFKKAGGYLSRIRGCAVVLLIAAFVLYAMPLGSAFGDNISRYQLVHSIICPGLLLVCFVLFDTKGNIRWFDPLWWCIPVLLYGLVLYVYPPLSGYNAGVGRLSFMYIGGLSVVVGYILLGIDKIKGRML